jgi:transcriptional regulator with XRE-family HTH domain
MAAGRGVENMAMIDVMASPGDSDSTVRTCIVQFGVQRHAETMGQLLRRVRQTCGLSQRDLAELLARASGNDSIEREHISRWEREDRIPNPYWRSWLGRALHVPYDHLQRAVTNSRRLRKLRQIAHDYRAAE